MKLATVDFQMASELKRLGFEYDYNDIELPSLDLAIKFIRDKYKIDLEIFNSSGSFDSSINELPIAYCYLFNENVFGGRGDISIDSYETFEKVQKFGIIASFRYCDLLIHSNYNYEFLKWVLDYDYICNTDGIWGAKSSKFKDSTEELYSKYLEKKATSNIEIVTSEGTYVYLQALINLSSSTTFRKGLSYHKIYIDMFNVGDDIAFVSSGSYPSFKTLKIKDNILEVVTRLEDSLPNSIYKYEKFDWIKKHYYALVYRALILFKRK